MIPPHNPKTHFDIETIMPRPLGFSHDKKVIGIRFTLEGECPPQQTTKLTAINWYKEPCKWSRITTSERVGEAFILENFFINEKKQFLGPLPCWYFMSAKESEFNSTPIMPNDKMTFEVTNTKRRTMKFVSILTCWTYSTE